jgi:hypothetical protein
MYEAIYLNDKAGFAAKEVCNETIYDLLTKERISFL